MSEGILRHARWYGGGMEGLAAVQVHEAQMTVKQLAGSTLPVGLLIPLLDEVYTTAGRKMWAHELWVAYEDYMGQSSYLYKLLRSYSQYGGVNYLVRVLRNEALRDAPIVAYLHVSCADKLNNDLRIPTGLAVPILAAVAADFPSLERWTFDVRDPAPWSEQGKRLDGGKEERQTFLRLMTKKSGSGDGDNGDGDDYLLPWRDIQLNIRGYFPSRRDKLRSLHAFRAGDARDWQFRATGAPHEKEGDSSTWGPRTPADVDWDGFDEEYRKYFPDDE